MAYQVWSVVADEQPTAAKWNILGTNDASFNDGSGIGAGAILPNHLLAGAAATNTWPWESWTPTTTNLTLGTAGTMAAAYKQIGKTVFWRLDITLGSSGQAVGGVTFTLPVTPSSVYNVSGHTNTIFGDAAYLDFGSAIYRGLVTYSSSTNIATFRSFVNPSAGQMATISSTTPFTWGATDAMWASGVYEAA